MLSWIFNSRSNAPDLSGSTLYSLYLSGPSNTLKWEGKYTNGKCDENGMKITFNFGVLYLAENTTHLNDKFVDVLVEINDTRLISLVSTWCNPEKFLFNLVVTSWNMSGWQAHLAPFRNQTKVVNNTGIETGSGLLVHGSDFNAQLYLWFESRDLVMGIFDEIKFVNDIAKNNNKVLAWNTSPASKGWKKITLATGRQPMLILGITMNLNGMNLWISHL